MRHDGVMTQRNGAPGWVDAGVDLSRPNPARMYDYYLGGAHNFGPDRELAQQALTVMPWMREAVRANRGFLRRAVGFSLAQGVRQFLDLGSGLPTAGATHEIAHALDPGVPVVYVDNEPVAASHGRLLLTDTPQATMVSADLTAPGEVIGHPEITALIDWDQPVAVLALAVLHFVPELTTATAILEGYRTVMVPGSVLVFSHVTADHDPDQAAEAVGVYRRSANPVHTRSHHELTTMLAGFDLTEPGLVDATVWRPDTHTTDSEHPGFYAAVARPRRAT